MIKVTGFYPYKEGARFDMDYYLHKHVPMVLRRLGPACKGVGAERGLGGGEPGSKPAYAAVGFLLFDSVEAFQAAMSPHIKEIFADIPNYTDIAPFLQMGEVTLG